VNLDKVAVAVIETWSRRQRGYNIYSPARLDKSITPISHSLTYHLRMTGWCNMRSGTSRERVTVSTSGRIKTHRPKFRTGARAL
jgi:hypothetical protein